MKIVPKKCTHCLGAGTEPELKNIGLKLRKERRTKDIPIQMVAKRMGVTVSYVTFLELGKRAWTTALKEKYQAALT